MHCPFCGHTETKVIDSPPCGRGTANSPAPRMPGVYGTIHDLRDGRVAAPHRRQGRTAAASPSMRTNCSTECRKRSKSARWAGTPSRPRWRGSATNCAAWESGKSLRAAWVRWSWRNCASGRSGLCAVRFGVPQLSRHRGIPDGNRSIAPASPPPRAQQGSAAAAAGRRRRAAAARRQMTHVIPSPDGPAIPSPDGTAIPSRGDGPMAEQGLRPHGAGARTGGTRPVHHRSESAGRLCGRARGPGDRRGLACARRGASCRGAGIARGGAPQARGATVYVTLEPCSHTGRTPPCADALIAAGVARVVCSSVDPNPKVAGAGIERLRAAGIAVSVGVLAAAARDLNVGFFSRFERRRPWLRLKLAMSLDARTTPAAGGRSWITARRRGLTCRHGGRAAAPCSRAQARCAPTIRGSMSDWRTVPG